MTPYYQDGAVTIYHGDCREILPTLFRRDCTSYCLEECDGHREDRPAIVSDPPYGMNENTHRRRFSGGGHVLGRGADWAPIIGDNVPFDPGPFLGFSEVILWGFNHYAQRLPVGTTLIWVKRYDHAFGSFLSDAEVAWMKGGHGVYCKRDVWNGGGLRVHPCEKPMSIVRWSLGFVKSPLIVDPYMGSGTTLRAAKDLGRRAIGIEIEERYCEIAAKRCAQEVLPL